MSVTGVSGDRYEVGEFPRLDEPTSLILPFSASTAAGASTFPVRGSSSRPAFTTVVGAGVLGHEAPSDKHECRQ